MATHQLNFPTTMIFDVMDTSDGVKILELGHGSSGQTGFKHVYGHNVSGIVDDFFNRHNLRRSSDNDLLSACFHNKACTAAFLGSITPEIFPNQRLFAPTPGQIHCLDDVKTHFQGRPVVLKTPSEAEGQGVFFWNNGIVPEKNSNEGDDREIRISFMGCENREDVERYGVIPAHYGGFMVAQEQLTPRPIKVEEHWLLPTTRIFATVIPEPKGRIEWEIHGMYHKLPDRAYASAQDAFSAAASGHKRDLILSNVSGRFISAPVPPENAADISAQITQAMTPVMSRLSEEGDRPFITNALKSDNPADQLAAVLYMGRGTGQKYLEYMSPAEQNSSLREAYLAAAATNPYVVWLTLRQFHKYHLNEDIDFPSMALDLDVKSYIPDAHRKHPHDYVRAATKACQGLTNCYI